MIKIGGWLDIPEFLMHTDLGYYCELRRLDIDLHKYYLGIKLNADPSEDRAEIDWEINCQKRFDECFKKRLPLIRKELKNRDLTTLSNSDVSYLVYN